MRNATILVVRLRGVATETIKNIVLAGIGKLIIMDSDNVTEEDLSSGFFFRDEDVGKKVRKDFDSDSSKITSQVSGTVLLTRTKKIAGAKSISGDAEPDPEFIFYKLILG